MPETFEAQLSELAARASDIAVLDEAAHLRRRGDRRARRRRGQAAFGVAAVATAVGVGLSTMPGTPTARTAVAGATGLSSASVQAASKTLPNARTTSAAAKTPDPLASAAAPHEFQIEAQVKAAETFNAGQSRYAVISKGAYQSTTMTFYATAESADEVTDCGATWVQVVAATLEQVFAHVTIKAVPGGSALADSVVDVQTADGASVLGKRIPLTTPIVLIAALD